MPAVTVQFHMMFDELVDFVADMMRDYSLAVELERFFPTTTHVVTTPAELPDEISRFGHVDRMWLLCKPPRARKFQPERRPAEGQPFGAVASRRGN
jgi:hypothetical protein